jgi:hypothetical protein
LAEDGVDGFGVFLDQQNIIAAGVILEVITGEVLEPAARRNARQQVCAVVLEAPEFSVADDRGGA